MSPLALWIDARCEPRNFPLAALHFQPLPFKSQTAHMPRAAGRATWQITAGLIIKNQHSPEGVAGEEEGYDGGGIPIKPTERPQTKERDEFLLLLLLLLTTSKKNSFQLQMVAFWRGKKLIKRSTGIAACVHLFVQHHTLSAFLSIYGSKKKLEEQSVNLQCDGGRRLFCCRVRLWHADPPPCCAALSAKQKHCTQPPILCLSRHTYSFCITYALLLHPSPPSSAPTPYIFFFFSPLANSQLSFLLCLLCLWSLIRKINDFVKCRSAAGISCEMRRNTCMWNISQWTTSVCL